MFHCFLLQTPLLLSCYCSDPIIAQMLLEANADPNREVYRYHNNVQRFFTPLHFLCEKGQSNLGQERKSLHGLQNRQTPRG